MSEHARPDTTIVLDLAEIIAIDDHGATALEECGRLAQTRDGGVEIHNSSPMVRRALRRRPPER